MHQWLREDLGQAPAPMWSGAVGAGGQGQGGDISFPYLASRSREVNAVNLFVLFNSRLLEFFFESEIIFRKSVLRW